MKVRSRYLRIAPLLVLSLTLLVFACAGAQQTGGGSKSAVTIEPGAGAKGSDIKIAGTGFNAGEEIDIVLIMGPGQRVGLGTAKVEAINADANGAFTAQSNIPSWAAPGTYDVVVEGGKGSLARTKLEVVAK
jgi:hypothetical protein